MFILHPGFLNLEAGPDFKNAVVQLAGGAARTGDIEVDPRPVDWLHHKHEGNPEYERVILHVVWRSTSARPIPPNLPLLELAPVLDAPVAELSGWLQHPSPAPPPWVRGHCEERLHHLETRQLEALLQEAALFRLQTRAERIRARAREAGWTQALWEGVFRALGYKHNSWPMQRLAELRPHWESPGASTPTVIARLLGLGGLLPSDAGARRGAASRYIRELWDCWWRDRDKFQPHSLPARSWRLAGLRPANHPQRRLALAAHWISRDDLPERLQSWCDSSQTDAQLRDSLLHNLNPEPDPYWSHHYTLRSGRLPREIPLLGAARTTDLAANIVLPWLWARARQGQRMKICREIEQRYLAWPAASDNALLKLARQRLLGRRTTRLPPRMAIQQGLLQITRDYCDHSNSLCERCRFPEVARQFGER